MAQTAVKLSTLYDMAMTSDAAALGKLKIRIHKHSQHRTLHFKTKESIWK